MGFETTLRILYNKIAKADLKDYFDKYGNNIQAMEKYLSDGRKFDSKTRIEYDGVPPGVAYRTEAIYVAQTCGLEGLKFYLENGGNFNPKSVDYQGLTEAMNIANHCGIEGIRFFVENGGRFGTDRSALRAGKTGAMDIAIYCQSAEALDIFVKNGGTFYTFATEYYPHKKSELMYIAEYCGKEGIKIFLENGGEIKPDRKDGNGKSEFDYILDATAEGHNLLEQQKVTLKKFRKELREEKAAEANRIIQSLKPPAL